VADNDPRPKQQQIADDIVELVVAGVMKPGDRLPSTRDLKERYGVASQTVQSGFRILQERGVTHGVPGRGTFVRTDLDPTSLTPITGSGGSAEYRALRSELQSLAEVVQSIQTRIADIEERLPASKRKPAKRAARS
jgi:DNA-binding GntR family transcriptional regulator